MHTVAFVAKENTHSICVNKYSTELVCRLDSMKLELLKLVELLYAIIISTKIVLNVGSSCGTDTDRFLGFQGA